MNAIPHQALTHRTRNGRPITGFTTSPMLRVGSTTHFTPGPGRALT